MGRYEEAAKRLSSIEQRFDSQINNYLLQSLRFHTLTETTTCTNWPYFPVCALKTPSTGMLSVTMPLNDCSVSNEPVENDRLLDEYSVSVAQANVASPTMMFPCVVGTKQTATRP